MLSTVVERTRDNLTDSPEADLETYLGCDFASKSKTELKRVKGIPRFRIANKKNQHMADCGAMFSHKGSRIFHHSTTGSQQHDPPSSSDSDKSSTGFGSPEYFARRIEARLTRSRLRADFYGLLLRFALCFSNVPRDLY